LFKWSGKMAYDGTKGGITTKSDAGTLLYNTSGKPYAVSSINPTTGLTPTAAQSITYIVKSTTGHEHLPWFNLINMNGENNAGGI